jgi:hypothetical protein
MGSSKSTLMIPDEDIDDLCDETGCRLFYFLSLIIRYTMPQA